MDSCRAIVGDMLSLAERAVDYRARVGMNRVGFKLALHLYDRQDLTFLPIEYIPPMRWLTSVCSYSLWLAIVVFAGACYHLAKCQGSFDIVALLSY